MSKPLIHFSHANGVPSKTYQKLFDLLSDDCDVVYLPVLGASKAYEVDDQWQSMVKQVIESVKAQSKGRQVIGLGHSLGGLTTLLASYQQPDLFKQVIVLDPPMIMGSKSLFFDIVKIFSPKMVDALTPAGKSQGRRDTWQNREEAYEKLRNKSLFRNFDEDCFQAYIEHGLINLPNGTVTLTIPARNEVEVFRTNPSRFWLPMKKPEVPVYQISGEDSEFITHGFPDILKKKTGIPYVKIKGSHMFPLEYPELTVQQIKALII